MFRFPVLDARPARTCFGALLFGLCLTRAATGQTLIGLNFQGQSTSAMSSGETAGVVSQSNWNNLAGYTGSTTSLVSDSGSTASGVAVSFNATNVWSDSTVSDTAGNNRLMRGYLDQNTNDAVIDVGVTGLNLGVYDVYVYAAGDGSDRTGQYTVGDETRWLNDNAAFSGSFNQATGSFDPGSETAATAGNYVLFSTLTASDFSLSSTGVYPGTGTQRAPVNAVQIVQHSNILYWDDNGSTAGAGTSPGGRWTTTNSQWTSNENGTAGTSAWVSDATAVFSAGTDATNGYSVNLQGGTVDVNAIVGQEGNPNITNGTLNFTGAAAVVRVESSGQVRIAADITSSNGLTKSGEGKLILRDVAKSYTGPTRINAGQLQVNDSNLLNSSTDLIIGANGEFRFSNASGLTQSVASLRGEGLVNLRTDATLSVGGTNANFTFGGSITGSGILAKEGTGTFTFDSDINFSGSVFLAAGTIDLNGFDLTADTLHITGNSILDFGSAIGSTVDVTNLIIDAGVTLTIQNWVDGVDAFYASNFSGATYDTTGSNPMNQIVFAGFTGNDSSWLSFDNQITPVPEPGTFGSVFVLLSLTALGLRRPRRV